MPVNLTRLFFTKLAPHRFLFFFFNDTATTEIYTLSLHDALPISASSSSRASRPIGTSSRRPTTASCTWPRISCGSGSRSEEHTSELQSRLHLVCRLLLEKKKIKSNDKSGRGPT